MDLFLLNALLGGCGIALVAGPLGSFVVWRRMAYFGDTLAHSALLGVALGHLLRIDFNLSVALTCAALAGLLVLMQRQRTLGNDTLLGIMSHSALSFGLVMLALVETVRLDLTGMLFGDILAVTEADLWWIWGGGAAVLAGLALLWRRLLAATVSEEVAAVEGMPVTLLRFAFMLLIALVVAIAMKIVGILLITALLIVPAAAARRFARTPEGMAGLAAATGVVAVAVGLAASL
ncbi:MAG TPA: metal ABC transporter permease, partial [Alphaproteobacteria bacterium]|nr:metal ABC transporter permease [Alphaproteobacteria bacterium]